MNSVVKRSRIPHWLAYTLSTLCVIAFGVSQFASSCNCNKGGSGSSARAEQCKPPSWDNTKWKDQWLGPASSEPGPNMSMRDAERPSEIQLAATDADGDPLPPSMYETSAVVAINIFRRNPDGTITMSRMTGFAASNNIVVTAAHGFRNVDTDTGQPRGPITNIDIIPPAPASNPDMFPDIIHVVAYQIDAGFNLNSSTTNTDHDDVALLYFVEALPTRVTPRRPVVSFQSRFPTGCQVPPTPNCVTENVTLLGATNSYDPRREQRRPRIRTGQAVIVYQEQNGNSQRVYLWPPIDDRGDSGGPVEENGEIIGIVYGNGAIPVNYNNQQYAIHAGTIVQLLDETRMNMLTAELRLNITNFVNTTGGLFGRPAVPPAPWFSPDGHFGVLVDFNNPPAGTGRWTLQNVLAALLSLHFIYQYNPPRGGCGP